MIRLMLLALLVLSGGCHVIHYNNTECGEFYGAPRVQWISGDRFIFIPDSSVECDFYFKRSNGDVVRPKLMFTDGGSIPRVMWSHRSYSPWGYAPAFLAHDWVFEAHRHREPGEKEYSFKESAQIMSEATKTLMTTKNKVTGKTLVERDIWAMYVQHQAVKSPFAKQAWDRKPEARPDIDHLCDTTAHDIARLLLLRPDAVPLNLREPLRVQLKPQLEMLAPLNLTPQSGPGLHESVPWGEPCKD